MCLGDLMVFLNALPRGCQVLPTTLSFPSQSRLADLSRTSTFSRNIRRPRLRTCIYPFTVVDVFEVDHRSLVCSIFRDSRCKATPIAHDVGKYSRTAWHTPTACHSTPLAYLAPIRRERLTVHEPMSRLAPCDRGALDAPGSESCQYLVARIAHMYLISQLPSPGQSQCPHINVLLPTSYRSFRFQENHHQSFPQFFASANQLSLHNLLAL